MSQLFGINKDRLSLAQDGRQKHHEDEVNRVNLNQLGIQTDLTKFRALGKEPVNMVERL